MNDIAIKIQSVHKSFMLSHEGIGSLKTLVLWNKRKGYVEKIDVLRGVSFEVKRGECLSLVGRNGAGKSTLLALVAKIYRPTLGTIETNGRIAPLLELGAGFHPDLSGIENIKFNGMILGLTRKEIAERMDRIIEFSELGGHIDAPVRTYSSGMQARLGFATAINVDAEILIVDEVLAVGDVAFREKCEIYIKEFKARGGSILFVSHSPDDVIKFSDRVIWLENGVIERMGDPTTIVAAYEEATLAR